MHVILRSCMLHGVNVIYIKYHTYNSQDDVNPIECSLFSGCSWHELDSPAPVDPAPNKSDRWNTPHRFLIGIVQSSIFSYREVRNSGEDIS